MSKSTKFILAKTEYTLQEILNKLEEIRLTQLQLKAATLSLGAPQQGDISELLMIFSPLAAIVEEIL